MDKRVYLKIKLKSLAEESRIIRKEELRTPGGPLRDGLALHRRLDVRTEARATHLAYGFLRGRGWLNMEPNAKAMREIDFKNLMAKAEYMVKKYGDVEHYKLGFAAFRDSGIAMNAERLVNVVSTNQGIKHVKVS